MKLILGLGNPGANYNFTRHNFGFLALDFYAKVHNLGDWKDAPKFKGKILKTGDTLFLKPETFYNEAGQSLRAAKDFYKIPTENILVVCDDFDLPFGQIRYREHGSAGGNNGLKSAIQHLGSENFPRLRLGTGNDAVRKQLGDSDFVLSRFTPDEKIKLPAILTEITKNIKKYIES